MQDRALKHDTARRSPPPAVTGLVCTDHTFPFQVSTRPVEEFSWPTATQEDLFVHETLHSWLLSPGFGLLLTAQEFPL